MNTYLIVGLGNPEKKYLQTRHNAGFICVDGIAKHLNTQITKNKFKSLYDFSGYKGHKLVLLKPQTYMNLSGDAVKAAMDFYKIPIEHVIVIYDDKDTDFGKIRLRKNGSGGSHNGVNHIINTLKSDVFPRVRIGIGSDIKTTLADYVLSDFTTDEQEKLGKIVENTTKAVLSIIDDGMDNAMNKFNKNNG